MKLKQFKRKNVIAFIKNNPVNHYYMMDAKNCLGTQFLKSLGYPDARCLVVDFSLRGNSYDYKTPKWFWKLFDKNYQTEQELIKLIEG